ncbi:hypothetical protein KJ682_16600 [bacterium]|nr:hypothetical protein [bacterium]
MNEKVRQTVWRWRDTDPAEPEHPVREAPGRILSSGLPGLVVGAVLWFLGWRWPGGIVMGSSLAFVLVGLVAPSIRRQATDFLGRLGAWTGRLLGVILLTPVFLLVVVPVGLYLKAAGRDPLHRRPLPPGLTYWIPRRSRPEPEQYRRQFLVEDPQSRALERPVEEAAE